MKNMTTDSAHSAKKMLINATRSEELRVAIIDARTQNLLDVIVGRPSYKTTVGNIYLAKVTSIEKSLGAAFVDFGSERHGFLPLKEISKEYFERVDLPATERPTIKDLIKEGQYLMVQVEKEERGSKGAALTTFISLAGSYLVLMPNNPRAGGISRRVEGEDRDELKDLLSDLALPEGMGIIVRTAGVGKSTEELEWDLNNLLKQWEAIKHASLEHDPPFFIHEESDLVTRIIRDYLREDFTEILVDDLELFEKVKTHIKQVRPHFADKVKLYTHSVPIFNRFQIEKKIESAHQRKVELPSGGSIVIDHTEALVAIDVNSARANKGKNIEETAFTTNMEATEELARQLRLRDIGGLIVIDFIDMSSARNRKEVENNLRNALRLDKARTQVGTISRFGLLEMSRQRLRHSLGEATQVTCPRCSGWGTIRGVESLALSIIRMIEDDATSESVAQIQVQLPIDVATFIINEKREMIADIEARHKTETFIIPNPHLESPHYHIKRITRSELGKHRHPPSYFLIEKSDTNTLYKKTEEARLEEKPAVVYAPTQPAPTRKTTPSLIKRLVKSLFRSSEDEHPPSVTPPTETTTTTPSQLAVKTPPSRPHGHANVHRARPSHHGKGKKRPESRPTPPPPPPAAIPPAQPEAFKAIEPPTPTKPEKQEGDTEATVQKPKTRRGTRGGRRRSHGHGNVTEKGTTQEMTGTPDHLPPFPTDLEDYYKQDITKTAPKQSQPKKHEKPKRTISGPAVPPHEPKDDAPIVVTLSRDDAKDETNQDKEK